MRKVLTRGLRNSSHRSFASDTFKFAAIFAVAALAVIFLASEKMRASGDVEYAATFYGP